MQKEGAQHGAARLCREYFDAVRSTYLLTWNPVQQLRGGAGGTEGRLGFAVGENALKWHISINDNGQIKRVNRAI